MDFFEFVLAHFLNTENKTIIKKVNTLLTFSKKNGNKKHMFNSLKTSRKSIKGEIVGK